MGYDAIMEKKCHITGADPGFQVRGVFHVKNHDFTQKKSYFFQF